MAIETGSEWDGVRTRRDRMPVLQDGVKAVHKPCHLETKRMHISAGSKTVYYRVPESYDTVSGCPACGKTVKEIGRTLETGMTREVAYEEQLRRRRKGGLPTKVWSAARSAES